MSALEPGLPLQFIGTLKDYQVDAYTGRLLRWYRALLTALALIGFFLALLGVAGVVTDSVVRRTREIGIRKALGARSLDVTVTLARESLITAAAGVTAGLLAVGLLQLAIPPVSDVSGTAGRWRAERLEGAVRSFGDRASHDGRHCFLLHEHGQSHGARDCVTDKV